jgi:hypothetical protein
MMTDVPNIRLDKDTLEKHPCPFSARALDIVVRNEIYPGSCGPYPASFDYACSGTKGRGA